MRTTIYVTEKMSDHSCYLRVSGIYVHENCCLGVQRHPPTYMERGRFQDGPETMFQVGVTQMWYLVSVTIYQLATRLLHTLANSIPSERSFSSMNILHSKSRNRLTVERVSKMLYIQVNRRTLGRVGKPAAQLEEEELEITDNDDDEDLILCRYSVEESTGVSGTVGTGSEDIPVCTSAGYGHFILVRMNWGFLFLKSRIFKFFRMNCQAHPWPGLGALLGAGPCLAFVSGPGRNSPPDNNCSGYQASQQGPFVVIPLTRLCDF